MLQKPARFRITAALLLSALLLTISLLPRGSSDEQGSASRPAPDPCAVALASRAESLELQNVAAAQRDAKQKDSAAAWENLGWRYVEAARRTHDPGYYRIAEAAADCLEEKHPGAAAAMLLRGHVWHSLHRFQEAEQVARELAARRGLPYDYGLLGDALLEQGRLDEAAGAYQKMMDLKPGLQSYGRAAHLRWLTGDAGGAIALMRLAASSGGPRVAEPTAWAWSRLAEYLLASGRAAAAKESIEAALRYEPGYAPALLLQGRLHLSNGRPEKALPLLQQAAGRNPLPEYQWALADALREAGKSEQATGVERLLVQLGPRQDPRTAALYLATRREQPELALRLAREELRSRNDAFTHDALAWALHAAGQPEQALEAARQALAAGVHDARLWLHAGVIAHAAGQPREARRWLEAAAAREHALLPSEKQWLNRARSAKQPGGAPSD